MNPKIEGLIYALVIVLALVALALVAVAPGFVTSQVVYQGF